MHLLTQILPIDRLTKYNRNGTFCYKGTMLKIDIK